VQQTCWQLTPLPPRHPSPLHQQECRATVISKGASSRRPELASIATSGKHKSKGKGASSVAVPAPAKLFGGPLAPPASPKAGRGSGGAGRDLLTTRSSPEEE
jgi:hypothetical protein